MSEEDQRLRGGLPMTGGAMIAAIRELCGAAWLEGCETRTKAEFAKKGVFGWQLIDTNVILDVVPMPNPWVGQWGFRLKTANISPGGQVEVCEFYLPQSEIATMKMRSMN